jgi:hypothetical protein
MFSLEFLFLDTNYNNPLVRIKIFDWILWEKGVLRHGPPWNSWVDKLFKYSKYFLDLSLRAAGSWVRSESEKSESIREWVNGEVECEVMRREGKRLFYGYG